MAILTMSPLL